MSQSARRVVAAAEGEARKHRNSFVGTEHILLGLLADPGDAAARVLESLDVGLDFVRHQMEQAIRPGLREVAGPVPLTTRAQTVFELARQEAALTGQAEVDSVHLLLGLIREGDGPAAEALIEGGAELAPTRRAVGGWA